MLFRVDWFYMLTEEVDRKKTAASTSVRQKVKRFLSLKLKQMDFSMNVTIQNWKRDFLPLLLYYLFPVYTNSLMNNIVFFNVQLKKYWALSSFPQFQPKTSKKLWLASSCPTLAFEFHSHIPPPSSRHKIFLTLL